MILTGMLQKPGRVTRINGARRNLRPLCNNRTRRYNRTFAHYRAIHDDSAHANQHVIVYRTAVNNGVMTDGYMIADNGFEFLISTMDHHTVLNIGMMPDLNAVYIASYHGVEPYGTVISHFNITNQCGIRSDPAMFAGGRCNTMYR